MLSIQETQDLLEIINRNQLVVLGQELGPDFFSDSDKALLEKHGIDWEQLYTPSGDTVFTSFHFGILAEALGQQAAGKVTYPELKKYIEKGKYIPTTFKEKATIQSIKLTMFSSLKSLNSRIFSDVNNIIGEEGKRAQMKFLAEELKQGITDKQTVTSIAHSIAKKTGDWSRDFDRIIEYSSHTAIEQGKAAEIQRQAGDDEDPLVYKTVFEGACKYCIKVYLTNGIGSEPKIFRLSELRANGSNIGRKPGEWKAIIDAIHPYCRCRLHKKPEGFAWNDKTQSFDIIDPNWKPKVKSRKPILIKIGNQEAYV